ncbi:MAG: hypothetical protein HQK77_17850 [Desulfobacterales bacterium]|nr:hypothetical protein [Desulfobacterales bacterium]
MDDQVIDQKKWERYSATISLQLKDRLNEARSQTGQTQEMFLGAMLEAYQEKLQELGEKIPELEEVQFHLDKVDKIVQSIITLSREKTDIARNNLESMKQSYLTENKKMQELIHALEHENRQLLLENESIKSEIEDRAELKQLFREKEALWSEKERQYLQTIEQEMNNKTRIQTLEQELQQKQNECESLCQEITNQKHIFELQQKDMELRLRKEYDDQLNLKWNQMISLTK